MDIIRRFQRETAVPQAKHSASGAVAGQEVSVKKLIIIVALVHLGFIGLMLMMPGCRSSYNEVDSNSGGGQIGDPVESPNAGGLVDDHFSEVSDPEANVPKQLAPPLNPTGPKVGTAARIGGVGGGVVVDPSKFGANSGSGASMAGTTYTVVAGDTLWGLSRKFGVSQAVLKNANGLGTNGALLVGQELKIPGSNASASSNSAAKAPTPSATGASSKIKQGTKYTVSSGDTLDKIARRAGITLVELRTANNIKGDMIRVGQILTIPVKGQVVKPDTTLPSQPVVPASPGDSDPSDTTTEVSGTAATSSGAPTQPNATRMTPPTTGYDLGLDDQGRMRYVVGEKETLRYVAMSNGLTPSEVRNANPDLLTGGNDIEAGMILLIPQSEEN